MKKYLSVLMAVCLCSAFPGVLNCACADADCGSLPGSILGKSPTCHHAATPASGASSSRKECCGKCRIEKAAVLSAELFQAKEARPAGDGVQLKEISGHHKKILREVLFRRESLGLPPGFFIYRVINTTFSFCAPPKG